MGIILCPERESNPHALMDTWPSTMPVYQFQHLGNKRMLQYNIKLKKYRKDYDTY